MFKIVYLFIKYNIYIFQIIIYNNIGNICSYTYQGGDVFGVGIHDVNCVQRLVLNGNNPFYIATNICGGGRPTTPRTYPPGG